MRGPILTLPLILAALAGTGLKAQAQPSGIKTIGPKPDDPRQAKDTKAIGPKPDEPGRAAGKKPVAAPAKL